MMTRAQKVQEISNLSEKFGQSKAAFLVNFIGMNVGQVTELRKKLTPLNSEMKVVRNTLAKLALKDHPEMEEAISSEFVGNNAIIFAYDDASAPAKALSEFSKDVEALVLKAGVMDGKGLDENGVKYLATLPSKEELQAKLLGTLMAPMSKFVRTLNEVPGSFVRTLNAYKETK